MQKNRGLSAVSIVALGTKRIAEANDKQYDADFPGQRLQPNSSKI